MLKAVIASLSPDGTSKVSPEGIDVAVLIVHVFEENVPPIGARERKI